LNIYFPYKLEQSTSENNFEIAFILLKDS